MAASKRASAVASMPGAGKGVLTGFGTEVTTGDGVVDFWIVGAGVSSLLGACVEVGERVRNVSMSIGVAVEDAVGSRRSAGVGTGPQAASESNARKSAAPITARRIKCRFTSTVT